MSTSLYGASAEYAMHSLLILMSRSEPVSVRDLASFQVLPERFLAKLFTRLKHAGLIKSTEGIKGGYVLARDAAEITVRDILDAVDPERGLFECAEIREKCDLFADQPPKWCVSGMCQIHLFMTEAEDHLREFLATKTLADLGQEFAQKAPRKFIRDSELWFDDRRAKKAPGGASEKSGKSGKSAQSTDQKGPSK